MDIPVNLLKSTEELERDYAEIVRNLDTETIRKIESSPKLPAEMQESFKCQCAHVVYWQIQALKGDPRVAPHQPV